MEVCWQTQQYPYTVVHKTLGISTFYILEQYERNNSEYVTAETSRSLQITKHFSRKLQLQDKQQVWGSLSCVKKLLLLLMTMMTMTVTRLTH
jgi:hypothetical protein